MVNNGVRFEPERARHLLEEIAEGTRGVLQRHERTQPNYPSSAAGPGFLEHGRALAKSLVELHMRSARRSLAVTEAAERALREVARLAAVNDAHAAELGRLP